MLYESAILPAIWNARVKQSLLENQSSRRHRSVQQAYARKSRLAFCPLHTLRSAEELQIPYRNDNGRNEEVYPEAELNPMLHP